MKYFKFEKDLPTINATLSEFWQRVFLTLNFHEEVEAISAKIIVIFNKLKMQLEMLQTEINITRIKG